MQLVEGCTSEKSRFKTITQLARAAERAVPRAKAVPSQTKIAETQKLVIKVLGGLAGVSALVYMLLR